MDNDDEDGSGLSPAERAYRAALKPHPPATWRRHELAAWLADDASWADMPEVRHLRDLSILLRAAASGSGERTGASGLTISLEVPKLARYFVTMIAYSGNVGLTLAGHVRTLFTRQKQAMSSGLSKLTPKTRRARHAAGILAEQSAEAAAVAARSGCGGRAPSYLNPQPTEDDALLMLDPSSGSRDDDDRRLSAVLRDFDGALTPEEAQEIAIAIASPQSALPSLLAFFAGPRVAALVSSRSLSALLEAWLAMPLAWGRAPIAPCPPHVRGLFADAWDDAVELENAAKQRMRQRKWPGAAPTKPKRRRRRADSESSGSEDEWAGESGDGGAREEGKKAAAGAADGVPPPAADGTGGVPDGTPDVRAWAEAAADALGPLAAVPVRPSEAGALGSQAGAFLEGLISGTPGALLGPADALVAAACSRAGGAPYDSPYALLLPVAASVVAFVDAAAAEADRILAAAAIAAAGSAPAAAGHMSQQREQLEGCGDPRTALRDGWLAFRSTVDVALLPALRACVRAAARAGRHGIAAAYAEYIALALGGAPTASLLGLPADADLSPLEDAAAAGGGSKLMEAVGALLRRHAAAAPPQSDGGSSGLDATVASAGYAPFLEACLLVTSRCSGQSENDHAPGGVKSGSPTLASMESALSRVRVSFMWQRHRQLIHAWLEALRCSDGGGRGAGPTAAPRRVFDEVLSRCVTRALRLPPHASAAAAASGEEGAWSLVPGVRHRARVVVASPSDAAALGDSFFRASIPGARTLSCFIHCSLPPGCSLSVIAGVDALSRDCVTTLTKAYPLAGPAAAVTVPGDIVTFHLSCKASSAGANADAFVRAEVFAPVDSAAAAALQASGWPGIWVRAAEALALASSDRGLPDPPGEDEPPPGMRDIEHALSLCGNDPRAASAYIVHEKASAVSSAVSASPGAAMPESLSDDTADASADADGKVGLYALTAAGLRFDLHLCTATVGGDDGAPPAANSESTSIFGRNSGDDGDDFRESVAGFVGGACKDVFVRGTATGLEGANGVALPAAAQRRGGVPSASVPPLPYSRLPSFSQLEASYAMQVRGVPYVVQRWTERELGPVARGADTPSGAEVAAAAAAAARTGGDGAAPTVPLFRELDGAYRAHGAPRVVELTAAGQTGRSTAAARLAERTLGRSDWALSWRGALLREPALVSTTTVQADGSMAIRVEAVGGRLCTAAADLLTGAFEAALKVRKSGGDPRPSSPSSRPLYSFHGAALKETRAGGFRWVVSRRRTLGLWAPRRASEGARVRC